MSESAVSEEAVSALVDMGFPRTPCVEALRAVGGDVDAAADLLLRGLDEYAEEPQKAAPAAPAATAKKEEEAPPSSQQQQLHGKKSSATQVKLIRTSSSTMSTDVASAPAEPVPPPKKRSSSSDDDDGGGGFDSVAAAADDADDGEAMMMTDEEGGDFEEDAYMDEDDEDGMTAAAAAAAQDDESWFAEPDAGEEKQFRVLERKQLEEMMLGAIDQVAAQLALEKDDAQALLRFFGWKLERLQNSYFDRPEHYLEAAGLRRSAAGGGGGSSSSSSALRSQSLASKRVTTATASTTGSGGMVECSVCLNDVPASDMFALKDCGHMFCLRCWQEHFEASVKTRGSNVVNTKCMHLGCNVRPGLTVWRRLAEPKIFERYFYFLLKEFVEKNGKYVFCVNPKCGRAIQYLGAGHPSVVVECTCGSRFCFSCGAEQHNPISCEMLRQWRARNSDDTESERLVRATSKPCFHCGFPTERNQGCNHMTCPRCRGEWCWMCRGDWKTHGSHTGGYFSCNRYDSSEAKKMDEQGNRYLEDAKRFKHYCDRYMDHEATRRQLIKMAPGITKASQEYGVQMHQNFDAVGEAITLLLECRQILKYTYVYGFYLKPGSKEIPFFEYVQANAEGITERLSKLVTTPVDKMDLDSLKNLLSVTRKYVTNLSHAIETGLTQQPVD